jgi:glycosidase
MKQFYRRICLLLFGIFLSAILFAQDISLTRIDPPSWWIGMKNKEVQLMVYGKNIADSRPLVNNAGVLLKDVILVENPNYLFLNLEITENAVAGAFTIDFINEKNTVATYNFVLNERNKDPNLFKGFDNSDVIYLLMPDRFSNGDATNDNVDGMHEKADRSNPLGRHGGDIKGIAENLDYFEGLGVTALWINPMQENNMPKTSYHGYAITDYYKTDPRYGTNEDYKNLVGNAHKKGLKIVMDMVFNHCGTGYYWNNDLPSADWYNQWPEFTRSNYRGGAVSDPHASPADYRKMVAGWFDVTMADLNQDNPLLANFLIQNSIWWIEYLGLDAIRQDTYPYAYNDFMTKWMKRLLEEYPDYNVVGEVWLNNPGMISYWLNNAENKDAYESFLTNIFDFPLMFAVNQAFNEEDGWDRGTARLYEILTQDFLYSNPNDLVIFLDNHDGDRFYSKMNENINNFKLGMAFLLTTRGIPQLYYGTEILMTGREHEGHGSIREDFPGNWPGEEIDVETGEGLSAQQKDAYQWTKHLLNWRKTNKTVQYGKLTHYIPENGVYVYFKTTQEGSIMVLLNNNEKETTLSLSRFNGNLEGFSSGRSVMTRQQFENLDSITIPAKTPMIVELIK